MTPYASTETEFALSSWLATRVQGNRALARLDHLLRELTGLRLVILLREPRGTVELYPAGGVDQIPQFCQIFRAAPHGSDACRACRTMLAFSAFYQGLHEYTCHGGVQVIAGPAITGNGSPSRMVAVASCAFAQKAPGNRWDAVRHQARSAGVSLRPLGRAFRALPVLEDRDRQIGLELTEIAALLLGSIEDAALAASPPLASRDLEPAWFREHDGEILRNLAPHGALEAEETCTVNSFLDLIAAMMLRNPAVPYTVTRLAQLLHVTPNYFSSIFHKRTGQSFQAYLVEARLLRACQLLRSTRLDVGEVARRAGFRDPAYFSRRFRQSRGCSPTAWRVGRDGTPDDGIESI